MFRWYAVCEGMQHRCDCHGFKGGHHLLSVSNCIPVLEASWATMVTRRSRCLWTPSKAKSTSKIWKLMGQCRLQWPYIIRIHPQGVGTLTIYKYIHARTQYNTIWIWTDLFQNNGCKKPASQRNKPTKQLQPRDDLQAHFPGFFRFGCLLPGYQARMVEAGYEWRIHRSPVFPTEHSSSSLSISVAEFRSFTAYPSFWCRKQMSGSHLLSSDKLIRLFRKSHSAPSSNKEFINI